MPLLLNRRLTLELFCTCLQVGYDRSSPGIDGQDHTHTSKVKGEIVTVDRNSTCYEETAPVFRFRRFFAHLQTSAEDVSVCAILEHAAH